MRQFHQTFNQNYLKKSTKDQVIPMKTCLVCMYVLFILTSN